MKKKLTKTIATVVLTLISSLSFSQVSYYMNYAYFTGSTSCNVFNLINPPVIGGLAHYPLSGGVEVIGSAIDLKEEIGTGPTNLGTAFAIKFPFKKGYVYTVNINATKASSDALSAPMITLSLFNVLPNPDLTDAYGCGPVGDNYWTPAIGKPVGNSYLGPGGVTIPFTGDNNYSYLSILATQGSSTAITDLEITSITITESVAISLSPASVAISCGTPLTQTFTAVNTNNVIGINNYTWNLGTAPNGWQYNGSPAPASITTVANTITLTAPACGNLPNNISVIANLNGYSVNAGLISTAFAPLSISGAASVCSTPAVYTIKNLNCSSASVVWSATPSNIAGIVSNSPSQNQATVSQIKNGVIGLTATVNNACGVASTVLTTNVQLGAGNPPNLVMSYDNICGTFLEAFTQKVAIGTTGFIWNMTGAYTINSTTNTSYYHTYINDVNGGDLLIKPFLSNVKINNTYKCYLTVQAQTNCGLSAVNPLVQIITVGPVDPVKCNTFVTKANPAFQPIGQLIANETKVAPHIIDAGNTITVYPNPTTSTLNFEVASQELGSEAQIMDGRGYLLQTVKLLNVKTSLNVSSLSSGLYFILIKNKNNSKIVKFVKQ